MKLIRLMEPYFLADPRVAVDPKQTDLFVDQKERVMSEYMEYGDELSNKIKNLIDEENCVRRLGDSGRADDLLLEMEELEGMLLDHMYPCNSDC